MNRLPSSFRPPRAHCVSRRARRRGVSMWLFVVSLPMIFGMCGLVIDMGQLYARRAQAQRAADAAALAAAELTAKEGGDPVAAGIQYANLNGFSTSQGDTVDVQLNYISAAGQNSNPMNTVKVSIAHMEPVYFAPVCETLLDALGWSSGAAVFSRRVTARAVARYFIRLPMSTGGNYGIASGSQSVVNNIINGPYSAYDDADPYSGMYLLNGASNPRYSETGGYQNFTFHVSDDFVKNSSDKKVYLQIFDPDSGNYDFNVPLRQTPHPDNLESWRNVKTKYEILKDGNVIATAQYNGDSSPLTDMKWVTPDGFAIDLNQYGAGDYHVRVSTTDGNTSNNYALRAGPVEGVNMDDLTWNQTYGDQRGANPGNIAVPMNADGRLTIGFQTNGTATLQLGYLDKTFAGKTVQVSHYDLDIGATGLTYTLDSMPNWSNPVLLPTGTIDPTGKDAPARPGNGIWATDEITLPDNFQGGNLQAQYSAGVVQNVGKDGSAWELYGEGKGDGVVKLIE